VTSTPKKKFLLVLQGVLKARAIAPDHPQVHKKTIEFLHSVESHLDSLNPVVKNVIITERDKMLAGKSLEKLNQEFLAKFSSSLPHRHVVAELLFLLSPNNRSEAIKILTNLEGIKGHSQLKECIAIHETLVSVIGDANTADEYKKKAKSLFPYATFFVEPSEVEQKRKQREDAEKGGEQSESETKTEKK